MRKLRKVKFDPKAPGLFLAWEDWDKAAGCLREYTLKSSEKATTELLDAFLAMRSHLLPMCELAELIEPEEIRIRGITVTEKDGIRGIVITGIRTLRFCDTPLILNTPYFVEDSEDERALGVFAEQCGVDLDELERLVWKYLDGDRQQGQLDLDAAGQVRKAQESLAKAVSKIPGATGMTLKAGPEDFISAGEKRLAAGMRSGLDKQVDAGFVALGDEELEDSDAVSTPLGGGPKKTTNPKASQERVFGTWNKNLEPVPAPLTGAESAVTGQAKISN